MENNNVIVSAVEILLPCGTDWSRLVASTRDNMPVNPWPEGVDAPQTGSLISKIEAIDANKYMAAGQSKILSRFVVMSVNCAGDALKSAGYLQNDTQDVLDDIGCIVGTSRPELGASGKFIEPVFARRFNKINPVQFPLISRSAAVGQICIQFQLRGYCPTLSLSRISGAHAVARCMDIIKVGRAKRMLAGGVETLSIDSIRHNKMFHREYFGEHSNRNRENLIPAEGACFMMLQEESVSKQSGKQLARLCAWRAGRLADINVFPERLLTVLRDLLISEQLDWNDVGLVSTSLLLNETPEEKALSAVIAALDEEHQVKHIISSPISVLGDSEACAATLIIANAVQYIAGKGYIGQLDSSVVPKKSAIAFIVDREGNYFIQIVKTVDAQV